MADTIDLLRKRFSQSELARLCGVQPQAVQRWFSLGYVPADRALRVSEVSGISLAAILSDTAAKRAKGKADAKPAPKRRRRR